MISDSIKQAIFQDLLKSKKVKEIANNYGVSEKTVYRIRSRLKSENTVKVTHDLELRGLKRELLNQKARYRQALDKIKELQEEISNYEKLADLSSVFIPADWQIKPTRRKEVIAVTVASDWHIDEEVVKDEIGGVNEYNASIAKQRIKWYFRYVLRLLNMCRKESTIQRLIVAALGDFISGWIHEELIESNTMTPPEACLEVFELWVNGLKFLLNEGDLNEIDVVCCCGNHSRITKRNQIKKSHKKTYEWLIYQFLAKWFAMQGEKRVKFQLPHGYSNWMNIFGSDVRFHHGNRIQYRGGVGGIHIPLRKTIAQWNKARHADLDVLAHWHTRETSRDYVINGSVIGYSEFSEFIKADYEPPQQSFFILHPIFGKTAEFPIVLTPKQQL